VKNKGEKNVPKPLNNWHLSGYKLNIIIGNVVADWIVLKQAMTLL